MLCSQASYRRRDRHETSAWGKLDEHNCYDFIWCIDVLEDILDNRRVVESFYRALKPGGYLYLHIPYDSSGKRIYREQYFAALMTGLMKST
jgi:2-polyprenyl-3-methyl-5-hydroxy-6-metoxy-1,4-benzoquinol methylase